MPVLMGVSFAVLFNNPRYLMFAAFSPLMVIGNHFGSRFFGAISEPVWRGFVLVLLLIEKLLSPGLLVALNKWGFLFLFHIILILQIVKSSVSFNCKKKRVGFWGFGASASAARL